MAYNAGGVSPVPFQIDPRGPDGGYLLGPPDSPLTDPVPAGRLSADDELVFMASDAGEKGEPSPELEPCYEIMIRHPDPPGEAWVYAGRWKGPHPPRSEIDYLRYRRDPDGERIVTDHYVQGFEPGGIFFTDLMVSPGAGGSGEDMFDKLKMRTTITAIGGITLSTDESDFSSKVVGVRDGPVRIIRVNATSLRLVWGISTPSVRVNGIFYRDSFEVPSTLSIPFRADLVLRSMEYYQGCDLRLASGPFTYYSDAVPEGVAVDGSMDQREREISTITANHHWGLVAGEAGVMFYEARWDESAPVKVAPYYLDDADLDSSPEYEPGEAMFGFRLINALALARQDYDLNIVNYVAPDFKGDARTTAESLLTPLEVAVTPLP